MYTNFDDIDKAYGLHDGTKTREDLTEEELRAFINDCFDTYEHIGFAETFDTPYSDMKDLVGQKFTVLDRVKELEEGKEGVDLECLPMWNIRFENGFETAAHPEEICLAERNMEHDKSEEVDFCDR